MVDYSITWYGVLQLASTLLVPLFVSLAFFFKVALSALVVSAHTLSTSIVEAERQLYFLMLFSYSGEFNGYWLF